MIIVKITTKITVHNDDNNKNIVIIKSLFTDRHRSTSEQLCFTGLQTVLFQDSASFSSLVHFDPLIPTINRRCGPSYSNMVHWPLIGGLLHLVQ